MEFMLQFGFPAILVIIGVICLLVSKRTESKGAGFGGLAAALAGVVWFIVGTF